MLWIWLGFIASLGHAWFFIRIVGRRADSTGRRNTKLSDRFYVVVESFSRRLPTKRFARPVVQGPGYGLDLVLTPSRQARADVFDYIECFHNPRMQRRLNAKDQAFRLLTQQSV